LKLDPGKFFGSKNGGNQGLALRVACQFEGFGFYEEVFLFARLRRFSSLLLRQVLRSDSLKFTSTMADLDSFSNLLFTASVSRLFSSSLSP